MLKPWIWLSVLVVVLDQATKYLAEALLVMHQPVPILSWFNLMLTYNTGAAFSFLANEGGWPRWFFLGMGSAVSIGLVIWLTRLKPGEKRLAAALTLILGGAVGNLIDRAFIGQVIDFIQIYYNRWYWPAFNIADSAITLGAVLLVVDSLWSRNTPPLKLCLMPNTMGTHIHLANPRGFCAGVDRAIGIVDRALDLFGAPIYVRHEVVHNRFVVDNLRQRGAVFVEELDEVPDGATVIFSAHGVAQAVREQAAERGLKVFDATCPLVTKVHTEVSRHARMGHEVILIGHAGHPEVEGSMGQYDERAGGRMYLVETVEDVQTLTVCDLTELAYVTQTTLSVDDTAQIVATLRERFPAIEGPRKDDICYATQNRQDAVKDLSRNCELLLVVGSRNSSNSNRLRELAEKEGTPAYLIDGPNDIDPVWLTGKTAIGVTAGASAPEVLVEQVISRLRELGAATITESVGREENVMFALPKELR